jgi:serine/threonine protein kinase
MDQDYKDAINVGDKEYLFRKLLGRGGFGLVYLYESQKGGKVAVKVPFGYNDDNKKQA